MLPKRGAALEAGVRTGRPRPRGRTVIRARRGRVVALGVRRARRSRSRRAGAAPARRPSADGDAGAARAADLAAGDVVGRRRRPATTRTCSSCSPQSAVADMITRTAGRKSSIAGGLHRARCRRARLGGHAARGAGVRDRPSPTARAPPGDVYRQRTGVDADRRHRAPGHRRAGAGERRGPLRPAPSARSATRSPSAGVPRAVDRQRRRRAARGRRPAARVPARRGERAHGRATAACPAARSSDELLEPDPHAPFGVRMDNDAAYRAFSDAWQHGRRRAGRGLRPAARRPLHRLPHRRPGPRPEAGRAPPHRRARRAACSPTSIPAHDAVFVVSPASPRRGSGLAVTGHPRAGRRAGAAPLGDQPAQRLRVRDRHRADHPRPARAPDVPSDDGGPGDGGGERRRRARRPHRPRSSTPTRTRCSATRRSRPPTTSCIALTAVLALAACAASRRRAPAAPASCASSRWRCSASSFATYLAEPAALRPQRQRGGVLRVPRRWARSCSRSACSPARARAAAYLPLALALAATVVAARRSTSSPARGSSSTPCSGTRRPSASACRGRATSRSRSSPRRCCCSAGSRCGAAPAASTVYAVIAMLGVHAAGDGGAAVRRRLRRRDRRCARASGSSRGCCSAAGSASAPS